MGNVFLSDLCYALSAECVLGCGVKVALGAEVLGRPRRAACLWGSGVAIIVSFVSFYVYFKELRIIIGLGLCERRPWDVVRSWGPRGAGKAAWAWAWESPICVGCTLPAGFCITMWSL